MKNIDELFKEYFSDFEVEHDVLRGMYIIKRGDKEYAGITTRAILCHGKNYRDYEHVSSCDYHIDNYTDDSWRLAKPPYCDCPYTIKVTDLESMFRGIRYNILRKISVEAEP